MIGSVQSVTASTLMRINGGLALVTPVEHIAESPEQLTDLLARASPLHVNRPASKKLIDEGYSTESQVKFRRMKNFDESSSCMEN